MSKKILIIGGVAGGASTATRLRRLDEKAKIIMLERGEHISFANCGLPYYIGGVISSRDALIVQTVEDMEAKYAIDVRTLAEVTNIDASNKKVTILNHKTNETYDETYDVLVISTGAYPVKPKIPGIDEAQTLFTLRNIPDTDKIKNYIDEKQPKHATVIGGGFIGLEMAENLHHLGLNITLVEMAEQVMASIDYEMAQIVHQHLIDKGIDLILKDGVKTFSDSGHTVTLGSGKSISTDLIVFAIGVRPENQLAIKAGLKIGERGGILVDKHLKTSDPNIYALGDAVEVEDFVNHRQSLIPLAGPANKQGRIVANNICGIDEAFAGTLGTSVAKVFDYIVGSTGNNEKYLKSLNLDYRTIHIHPGSHAGYYPGASTLSLKILFDPKTEKIYGAQAVGMEGVDKRIDVLATAIRANMKVTDLKDLELSYAPPFSSAKDPVNMLGFTAENIINNLVDTFSWSEVEDLIKRGEFILDVREPIENELGKIPGSINIPFQELRNRLKELPKNKTIYVYCQTGIRAYSSSRILAQNGFKAVNLDGGYKTYQCVYNPSQETGCQDIDDSGNLIIEPIIKGEPMSENKTTIRVDACGLQCPGPIVQVYKSMQQMNDGEILEIKATDPGFAKDIRSWAEKTKNTLIDLTNENKIITATIKKGTATAVSSSDNFVSSDKENTTIVVFSQDLDKAIAAFIIAQGKASMGKKVSLFFTFWGLNILRKPRKVRVKKTFIEKMFGMMMPRGTEKLPISNMNMAGIGPKMIKSIMKKKNVASLQEMMKTAMEMGVKITACAMSMDIMGIKREELIDGIDVAGVATYLGDTVDSNHNLFI
ncbi:MAG: CoA-disulfide reductase [Bacilli bacterium]|nr:CoA-disulfide reductase [Bacilli bacterium]MBN2697090.1 CoA-disulfide reductase [Bacilli bacterium]